MADKGRQRKFDDPIEAPDGKRLNTLREAVAHLAKTVPKRGMPAVTTAAEMLTYTEEREISQVFLARMAVMQACAAVRSGRSIPMPMTTFGESRG